MKGHLLRYRTLVLMLTALAVYSVGVTTQAKQRLADEPKDIVQTAIDSGNFKTLVKALDNARLTQTFKEEGPFTLFAPTDEAFARLPDELLADLMKPESRVRLASILSYHALPEKIMAREVMNQTNAQTVNGQFLTIRERGDTLFVDSSKVIRTDIVCSNGVIHVIDTVLIPQQTQPL